jgi:hypothetical protein
MCMTSMFKQYLAFVFRQYEPIKKPRMTMIVNHGLKTLWWGTFLAIKWRPWTSKQILFQVAIDQTTKWKYFMI